MIDLCRPHQSCLTLTLIGSYRFDAVNGRELLKTAKRLKFTAKMPMFRLGFTKLSNSNLKKKEI